MITMENDNSLACTPYTNDDYAMSGEQEQHSLVGRANPMKQLSLLVVVSGLRMPGNDCALRCMFSETLLYHHRPAASISSSAHLYYSMRGDAGMNVRWW